MKLGETRKKGAKKAAAAGMMRERGRRRGSSRSRTVELEPEPEVKLDEASEEEQQFLDSEEDIDDFEVEIGREVSFSPVVKLYTRVWAQVVGKKGVDFDLFSELVPQLRALLVCSVCDKLLAAAPLVRTNPSLCTAIHPICKECYGKEWTTPCSYLCQNNTDYFENEYFSIILKSYKDFCNHFIQSADCRQQLQVKKEAQPNYDAGGLVAILSEGALSAVDACTSEDECESDENELNEEDPEDDGSQDPSEKVECPIKQEPPDPHDEQEDEDFGHDVSEPEADDEWTSTSLGRATGSRANEGSGSRSTNTLFSLDRMQPSSSAPIAMRPPVTNWPDPIKVIQYATGQANMDMTRPQYVSSVVYGCSTTTATITTTGIVGSVVRAVAGDPKKLKVRLPKCSTASASVEQAPVASTSRGVRRGCRCGNATVAPGKLTCCGQRCPCYVDRKSCLDCRCKGCRNPHLPGGKKLLQGINAVMDTRTNTTTPLPTPSGAAVYSNIPNGSQSTFSFPLTSVANFGGYSLPVQLPLSIVDVTSLVQPHQQTQEVKIETTHKFEHEEDVEIDYDD